MNTKEKIAVMQAWLDGKKIVIAGRHSDFWHEVDDEPEWNWGFNDYRVMPEEIIKPSIDWDHVAEPFNFLATDLGGETFLYEYMPAWSSIAKVWKVTKGDCIPAQYFQSFKQGKNCPSGDSLIERPEG